jgi:hypothetical protein
MNRRSVLAMLGGTLFLSEARLTSLAFVLPFLAIGVTASAQIGPKLADYYTLIPTKVIDPNYSPLWIGMPFTADLNGDGNEDLVVLGVDFACCGAPTNVPQPGRVSRRWQRELYRSPTRCVPGGQLQDGGSAQGAVRRL